MRILNISFLGMALAFAVATAHADEQAMPLRQGGYALLEGGFNMVSPNHFFDSFISGNLKGKVKDGWGLSGAGGYKWSYGFRTELEVSYHRNSYKDFDTSSNPITGKQVTVSFMGNLLYDVNTGTRVTPYFGGGVGGTVAWLKNLTQVRTGILGIRNNESCKLAYQAILGFAIAIAPQWEAIVDARYRISDDHEFDLAAPDSLSKYNIHETTAMVGLRYAFP